MAQAEIWWVAQQNRVTPSPFNFGLWTLDLDLDLDCDNFPSLSALKYEGGAVYIKLFISSVTGDNFSDGEEMIFLVFLLQLESHVLVANSEIQNRIVCHCPF